MKRNMKSIRKIIVVAAVGALMTLMITGCHSDEDVTVPTVTVESIEDTSAASDSVDVTDTTEAVNDSTDMTDDADDTNDNIDETSADDADDSFIVEVAPAIYDSFDDVLEAYKSVYSENFDTDTLFDSNMSSLLIFMDKTPGTIGYLMYDLNFDGEDELLIGTNTGDDYQDQIILDAYIMKDGKAVQLFVSSERDRYYIMEDEAGPRIICNEWSASANVSGYGYYTMIEKDINVMQAIVYDDIADPENPWFMTYTDNHQVTPDESISEEEALAVIDSYSNNYKTFEYTPIQ